MWLYTFLLLIVTFPSVSSSTEENDEQRLVKWIFKDYNRKLRPITNTADVTNVTLNPALYTIVDTNEVAESITIMQWFRMAWSDDFLKWNASEYGDIQQLHIPISELWYPDIAVDNRIDIKTPILDEKNFGTVVHDGTVSTSILQVLTMHCKYHIFMFPFDIQNCTMVTGSWSYIGNQIDVFYTSPIDLSVFYGNPEWDLISMTARKSMNSFGEGDYAAVLAYVFYDTVIQRKPTYYLLTFVLPCFMITTVSIIGIFAPFNDAGVREEKVTMGLTTLLTMTVILSLIADKMPKSSEGLPLLGIYIMLQVALAAVTSLIAVVIMYQNRKWTTGDPIPTWILILTGLSCNRSRDIPSTKEAKSVAICTQNCKNGSKNQQRMVLKNVQSMIGQIVTCMFNQSEEEAIRKEWQHVTEQLDSILMITFLAVNCILTVSLLVIGYSNRQAPLAI